MSSATFLLRLLASAVLILSAAVFAFGDTVRLKDGSIIKGKIISFSGGKFVILIGQGERQRQMTFFADEIESIEFDNEGVSVPDFTSGQNTETRPPSYTERTDGNETIITVGSARRDQPAADDDRLGDTDGVVDPNAVAIDPNTPTGGPPVLRDARTGNSDDEPWNDDEPIVMDDDPILDDDPIDGEPVGSDTTPAVDPTRPQPVQIRISVLADDTTNGWTNAGWVVKKGQKIRIISNGRISLGNGRTSGPRGIATLPDANKLIKDRPTGALIAVIGDDNNDFIFIGENRELIAERDGALFLGVNEGNIKDNSGAFDVIIEIEAGGN
ncbi:MAG TPA: LecA/PA-IL family lectin [Aridibacter sp.]|nr:LecA/PA-IL family lectin [Aridibacter sp.]